jgi:mannan endo-1,4-beta-mannosidase
MKSHKNLISNYNFFLLTGILSFLVNTRASISKSGEIYLEAENAALYGVSVSSSGKGFSGTGYVTGFDNDGDRAEFHFNAEAGLYELSIGFSTPNGEKGYELTVNGDKTTGMFPATNTFSEVKAGKFHLKDGANTAVIGKGWGWFNLDYIRLAGAALTPLIKPPVQLSDSDATVSTRSLFQFLVDRYGEKILSGQQDVADIQYIVSTTGRSPAIGTFDLIDYSPSRVAHGSNPNSAVESWIGWAKKGGGIIGLCWHWNAPTDLIDQPGKEWWRGFYTDATTFDLKSALADTNSERYHLLLRDMDAIAVQLKKLQAADMPVLWRPLHEASGGWFWWGAKGPEPFKKLWRLMHERFTRLHGLHNLIWVYTSASGKSDWYPGDDAVDVVSLDVYTDPSSSMSGEWEDVQKDFNGRKLVALSESGTLPDPDKCRLYGTWWSWFSVWSGSYIRNANKDFLRQVYSDADVVTLDDLPDWRNVTSVHDKTDGESNRSAGVYPNPTHVGATLLYTLSGKSDVRIAVYDLRGRKLLEQVFSSVSAGNHSYAFVGRDFISGVYMLHLTAGHLELKRKLVLLK